MYRPGIATCSYVHKVWIVLNVHPRMLISRWLVCQWLRWLQLLITTFEGANWLILMYLTPGIQLDCSAIHGLYVAQMLHLDYTLSLLLRGLLMEHNKHQTHTSTCFCDVYTFIFIVLVVFIFEKSVKNKRIMYFLKKTVLFLCL